MEPRERERERNRDREIGGGEKKRERGRGGERKRERREGREVQGGGWGVTKHAQPVPLCPHLHPSGCRMLGLGCSVYNSEVGVHILGLCEIMSLDDRRKVDATGKTRPQEVGRGTGEVQRTPAGF